MSSTVCQGLQSCLESPLLNNKLAPPRSNLSHEFPPQKGLEDDDDDDDDDDEAKNRGRNDNLGGWSFIQALTHMSQTPNEIIKGAHEKVYVHPMDKNSSSILSKKSLEMCTESLGSESGSDSGESIEELSLPLIQRSRIPELYAMKKKETRVFPPPISSIRGSDIVQVLPRREGGRLLIKAVTVTSNNGYFQAERSDGRLRLSLFTESDNIIHDDDEEEDHKEEDEDEDEEEEREIGISNRLISSCKEEDGNGKDSMSNWGPFWVVIS